MSTQHKLGFIGLGIMGAPMAHHLLKAGHQLFTHTRSKTPDYLQQDGAVLCAHAAEVAQKADIVFLMLPDTPDVERVLFGEHGVAQGLVARQVGLGHGADQHVIHAGLRVG